jgi:hypothetical protein
MAKRDEMREALDQLRMLTGEGMFENKEWGGKKVAPDQQQQDPRMEALADLSKKLHEKDQRLIEKEKGLEDRERDLKVEKEMFRKEREQALQEEKERINKEYTRINENDSILFIEQEKLSKLKMTLDTREKDLKFRIEKIQQRETKVTQREEKYKEQKITFMDLTESLKDARKSLEEEKNKSEEWRKSAVHMYERAKDDALFGLKLFVRMWKHEILNMIQHDKLRCIIPWDTSTWFRANYYELDIVQKTNLAFWMNKYLDVKTGDLLIDIDIQTPRFVIFFMKSKLEKHATESWNGDKRDALKNMHCIQEDDWEKVDEKMKATDRTPW